MKRQTYLVKLFVKLAELGDFLHDLFPHKEGRVQHGVIPAVENPQGVIDQSLLQEHQRPLNTTVKKTTKQLVSEREKYKEGRMLVCLCSSHLQKVTSAPSHDSSPLSIKAVDHDHQVNVGILLLDGAVSTGALHLVVCILSGGNQRKH